MSHRDILEQISFDADGLVPAIAQDGDSGEVLMVAWMSAESLRASLAAGEAVYWSRSRGRLWRKGEESGHIQRIREIRLDCDGDTLLLRVEQVGGIACHTGRRHCFFRKLDGARWTVAEPVAKSPGRLHGGGDG